MPRTINPRTRPLVVAKSLQKNNLNVDKTARSLGVTRGAVQKIIKRNPEIFTIAMERAGLTDDKLFEPIKKALEATKSANFEGNVIDSDVPDHQTRLSASELGFKLKGRLNKQEEQKQPDQHLHLHFEDKNTDDLYNEITTQLAKRRNRESGLPPKTVS